VRNGRVELAEWEYARDYLEPARVAFGKSKDFEESSDDDDPLINASHDSPTCYAIVNESSTRLISVLASGHGS